MVCKQLVKVKRIELEADVNSPCKGLADALSNCIVQYGDMAELNNVKLMLGDQTIAEFSVSADNINVGDDGTDAYIEFTVKDFSSYAYEFDTVYVMSLGFLNLWGRYYFKWTGSWNKNALEYLEIVIRLWIRGLSGS